MNQQSKITYSAPGKIHFLGEHIVVHGKPAVLAATNLRIKVSVQSSKLKLQNYSTEVQKLRDTIESVIKAKFKLKKVQPYMITIKSTIPIGSGMGSSASASAAYLAALMDYLKLKWDIRLINELTFECDKVFNGAPSGGDNTTVVYGGFIWYRRELDFLKTFQKLPFKLSSNIKPFFVIDSGKSIETTGEMVAKVKDKLNKSRNKIQKIFDEQENLVKQLATSLKEGDESELMKIIKEGERNLERLGVVGKKAKNLVSDVEKLGGAAKIMGGGGIKEGSGMLLAYHKNPTKLLKLAKKYKLLKIRLGGEGLKKES